MKSAPFLLVCAILLSGCADSDESKEDKLREAEKAAQQLEVEATETTGVIRGIVVDETIKPVQGIVIKLMSTGVEQVTNEGGAFGFDGLEAGTYFITAAHPDYTQVQQSVDVVAGVSSPPITRIQVAYIPRGTPFIEALTSSMFISGSGWVDGVGGVTVGGAGVLSSGNWNFEVAIEANGSVAQTELSWAPTSPLGQNGRASGGTYEGNDGVDTGTTVGPAPLVMRANATEGDTTADNVYYSFYAWPSAGTPVGLAFNQEVTAYIHVFHNFVPLEGWQFGRDGEHPIPPR